MTDLLLHKYTLSVLFALFLIKGIPLGIYAYDEHQAIARDRALIKDKCGTNAPKKATLLTRDTDIGLMICIPGRLQPKTTVGSAGHGIVYRDGQFFNSADALERIAQLGQSFERK